MDTSVIVPGGHALEGFTKSPVTVFEVIDGLGVRIGAFRQIVRVKPADYERELLFKNEEGFTDFALLDKRGFEKVDPNPVEVPLHLKAPPTMRDQIVEQISRYLSARAQDEGYETLEEAMDFDIGGEVDDLQTRAEDAYLASFMPHAGRADNTPKRTAKPPKTPEIKPEVPPEEQLGAEVPILP